jgi:2-oxoglutarate dehydrogenase complex dehydrogenase (E1) component-like enzyme
MSNYIGHTSFLNGANATFVAELYSRYLERPESVDPEWGTFLAPCTTTRAPCWKT